MGPIILEVHVVEALLRGAVLHLHRPVLVVRDERPAGPSRWHPDLPWGPGGGAEPQGGENTTLGHKEA